MAAKLCEPLDGKFSAKPRALDRLRILRRVLFCDGGNLDSRRDASQVVVGGAVGLGGHRDFSILCSWACVSLVYSRHPTLARACDRSMGVPRNDLFCFRKGLSSELVVGELDCRLDEFGTTMDHCSCVGNTIAFHGVVCATD